MIKNKINNRTTLIEPVPQKGFIETDFIQDITERGLNYLETGFPIHFRGRTGTGKTTLAMHIASKIGRPVVLIHGDEEFTTADLVGGEHGYRKSKMVDNYIHSVLKTEENMTKRWVDNRLTTAVKYGYTLIYDEFTRSRPEANNILLSVLEENILELPAERGNENYLQVNPDFRVIFTSNPEEYAGTHETQDALRDRMVTIDLNDFDEDTEVAITSSKSDIGMEDTKKVVSLVRDFRSSEVCEIIPTVRASIMICKAAHHWDVQAIASNSTFRQICMDILNSQTNRFGPTHTNGRIKNVLNELIDKHCTDPKSKIKAKTEKKNTTQPLTQQ
ncbi:MAG: gas vesicle protein GvpN [Candidatus Marinimicrobia bacterium]|nr:gas vesicle protein GvpN [Candidatus Neomarinimicrobiota bacterium]